MIKNILLVFSLGIITTVSVNCTVNTNQPAAIKAAPQEIKIIGSDSTYPAMKLVAGAYEAKAENAKINFLLASQSETGIVGTKEGFVDLGSISRQLKPEEDDGLLVYRELARDALIVATHPSVTGVENLQLEDLKAIYSGKVNNWQDLGGPDRAIIVLDRPEDESGKSILRDYYLGKDFNNAPKAVIMRHETDLIAGIQNTPYSIGAFSLAYDLSNQLPVNCLSIDGIEPTPDNVQSGEYKMVRQIGIVWNQKPSEVVQKFIDFAGSEEAAKHLNKSGFITSSSESRLK